MQSTTATKKASSTATSPPEISWWKASRHQGIEGCKAATSGRGLVKIIDFGIARATDSDIAVTTMHTDVRELIGTLQYMSPEQCAGDSRDLDIRSDVYSLGVVLYELLCGQLPYDLSHTPIPQATRVIQETDPPRPSTISKRLKGNLEAIVLKALEKDREKRFQSAADLVRNIRNHLAGEPIDIRPPTRFALAIHWLVKHPIITTSAACLTIAGLTLTATSISVWYLNARPHHIELTPDGREARLMSVRNNILHTWSTKAEGGIRFAQLVERPPGFGGGKIALIGFNQQRENPFLGSLCAFDLSQNLDEPMWRKRVHDAELLPELLEHGTAGDQFGVNWAFLENIFQERPGAEIVVVFYHSPFSPRLLRIYDLDGELLFQVWHDGTVSPGHWLALERLLILAGDNKEATWPERGVDNVQGYPIMVFALRPRVGHIALSWMPTSPPFDESSTVVWYKCLLPPNQASLFEGPIIAPPFEIDNQNRGVRFLTSLTSDREASVISWLIDTTGSLVTESASPGDMYRLNDAAPDPGIFYLGDLPPIVSTPE